MIVLLLSTCTCSVQALSFDQMYIRIEESGDADVTLTYQLPVWEYWGMLSPWMKPEELLSDTLHRDVTMLCLGKEGARLRISQFAQVNGATYTTIPIQMPEATQYGPFTTVDLSASVVIVFPDNFSYTYPDTTTIPSLTRTLAPGGSVAPEPPQQACGKRNLPLSWLIPDELAPLVAVATGIGVVAVVNTAGVQGSSFFQKIGELIKKFIMKLLAPLVSRKEVEMRGLRPDEGKEAVLFTLSKRELAVIVASAVIFTLAFMLKDRLAIEGTTILVFILMGGMATVAHELSHRFFARRWQGQAEFQFWGLGTVMMLLTAGLFGTVFAKPSRALTASTEQMTASQGAFVAAAGPMANVLFALASVLIIPLGGILTLIGQAGFSMNLLAAVFDMVPMIPMDGKKLFAYSKFLWAVMFIPLILLYIAIYMV